MIMSHVMGSLFVVPKSTGVSPVREDAEENTSDDKQGKPDDDMELEELLLLLEEMLKGNESEIKKMTRAKC